MPARIAYRALHKRRSGKYSQKIIEEVRSTAVYEMCCVYSLAPRRTDAFINLRLVSNFYEMQLP